METVVPSNSGAAYWAGTVILGLLVLFFLFDAITKLMLIQPVIDATAKLGWPIESARPLGIVLLVCTAIFVFPRTAVVGAILLTGYLGGAVASQARIGSPLFTHVLFGAYLGVLMWLSVWLRNPDMRRLLFFWQ